MEIMRLLTRSTAVLVIALAFSTFAAAQDWRGAGHISGKVTDDTGQPVDSVVVKAQRVGSNGGTQAKTNKKGEWTLIGINGGQWNLDFEKPGYETSKITATVEEHGATAPVTTKLKKSVDPNVALRADLQKAAQLVQQEKYAEARSIYEGILQAHPEAYQVEPYIARTYYAEKNYAAAEQHLRAAIQKDPNNIESKVLLATVLGQEGKTDESRQLLATIDDSKVTDPTALVNVGIGLLNDKKPEEAMTWFDKSVSRFPDNADGYYYRGITELQLGKNDPAKADLTKFVQMKPDAPEAATAKGILEKLK